MELARTRQTVFSPFLLYAMCAHAIRETDVAVLHDAPGTSESFTSQARLLAFREVERGSSLSAISGFLLLSAKECNLGRVSQAWAYS